MSIFSWFGGLISSKPSQSVTLTNDLYSQMNSHANSYQQHIQAQQTQLGQAQSLNQIQGLHSQLNNISGIANTYPGSSGLYATNQSIPSQFNSMIQQQIKDRDKKQKEINDKFNTYPNEVKNLYEELKPFYTNQYTPYVFFNTTDEDKIKIAEIIEKHLKNIKFNSKLNSIIDEEN